MLVRKKSVATKNAKLRRVLVYRLGSLGDMVVALPSLHLVARAFPNAERRMLTNVPVHAKAPAAEAVLGGSGLVHGYVSYPVGVRGWRELGRLWWMLICWRPQAVVYLAAARGVEVARRDAWFFRLCGVRRLVGVPVTEGMQRNFYGAATGGPGAALADANGDGNLEPEAARLVRNIGELAEAKDIADPGRLGERASWDLRLTDLEFAQATALVDDGASLSSSVAVTVGETQIPFGNDKRKEVGSEKNTGIAVSVGTKVQAKDWGVENWTRLLRTVATEFPGRRLLMIGTGDESAASETAAAGWSAGGGGTVVNLCGRLTPRQSAAALGKAAMFLGHDSGPMHLAAAMGVRCVAVFAARNIPRQWFPYGVGHRVVYHRVSCAGCGLETCVVEGKRCILSITVEEVMKQVRVVLGEGKDNADSLRE